jgi:hypothetical protein
MRVYSFFIEDRRYSVATLLFAEAVDEADARERAAAKLAESDFYISVEIWDGDRQVDVITNGQRKDAFEDGASGRRAP